MVTGKDAWIPEIWSKKLLKRIHNISVMRPLVSKTYESDFSSGDTVHARLPAAVTVNTYTRETTITYESLTLTDTTFVIDQQKYCAFAIDDLDAAQLDVDFFENQIPEAAVAIRDTIDSRLLGHYADCDANNVVGTSTVGIVLTKDNVYSKFVNMGRRLDDNKALQGATRYAVVPPFVKELILQSPEMSLRSTNLVDDTVTNGKLANNFGGFEIHVTTNMAQVSNAWPLMFFTMRFITFAMQFQKEAEKVRLINYFGDGYRSVYLYGSKVFTNYDGDGGTLYAAA